jgi:hypothetical protein
MHDLSNQDPAAGELNPLCATTHFMSNKKLRVHNTDADNLIANLRGEVGEVISTWILLKNFMCQSSLLQTDDIQKDLENEQLLMINSLVNKLQDEIISRLSELSEKKVGRLNFFFAYQKINNLEKEVDEYSSFINKSNIKKKRNFDISHKELPERWSDHISINVPYKIVVIAIVKALRLMKEIDKHHLGPKSKYYWKEMRKRRYRVMYPAKVGYMIMPRIWLSNEERASIIIDELAAEIDNWHDMSVKIDGLEKTIRAYGEMGAIDIDGNIMILDKPFTKLESLNFNSNGAQRGTFRL